MSLGPEQNVTSRYNILTLMELGSTHVNAVNCCELDKMRIITVFITLRLWVTGDGPLCMEIL